MSFSEFLVMIPFEFDNDEIDNQAVDLALDILNEHENIDKEELIKIPYALCEASGQNARQVFDTDEQFSKGKFLIFENNKIDKDEFLRLVKGCKKFVSKEYVFLN